MTDQARCHACPWQGLVSEVRGPKLQPDGTYLQSPCPRCGGSVEFMHMKFTRAPAELLPVAFTVFEPPPFVATDECASCGWKGSWDGAVCPECGAETRPVGGSS